MEDAVTNVAQRISDIVDEVFPPEESGKDAKAFNITVYLTYYQVRQRSIGSNARPLNE